MCNHSGALRLSSYTKRLDPIPSVSLESVLTVLAERRDSSTGPDGIPFSVYRLLADMWLPSFYVFSVMLPWLLVVDVWSTAPSTLLISR